MDCVVPKPKKPFTIEGMLIAKKFTKLVKPVIKLLSRRARTNVITPSSCTYDVEECLQNQINESDPFNVQFQFHHEEEDENARNEALERRLQESVAAQTTPTAIQTITSGCVTLQPVIPGTYFAVPVHFIEAPHGGFVWVPADADIAPRPAATESQLPSQQVPCIVV